MTNTRHAPGKGVNRASQFPRTANTLRLHHLMEEQQRLEIAERIRQLRERSPFTQPQVAEKLGLTLRAYQKLEQRGTTKWERCEELATIYGVDAGWIWDGTGKGETPDLVATLNGDPTQLDRIETMLRRLLAAAGLESDEITEAAEEVALADVEEPLSPSETDRRKAEPREHRAAS